MQARDAQHPLDLGSSINMPQYFVLHRTLHCSDKLQVEESWYPKSQKPFTNASVVRILLLMALATHPCYAPHLIMLNKTILEESIVFSAV